MFDGFTTRDIETSGARIHCRIGGTGRPVLLLHGYPQNHVMWHKIAPSLAARFTVVAVDLRGYGDSSKPPGGERHAAYAKRAMAQDMAELMSALGFERFAVVGHDRGARVTHRLALDHAARVERVVVLDICPTATMYAATNKEFATAYYHWFFLIQPFDLPERMIGADPDFYLEKKIQAAGRVGTVFTPEALAEYKRCFRRPETIHALCEDYRAAATIDLEHDAADAATKLAAPLLALWGARGVVGQQFDPIAAWREKAMDVRGRALDCGHFLAEERPEETLAEIGAFLS
jgi:haloacetate dehalogenase